MRYIDQRGLTMIFGLCIACSGKIQSLGEEAAGGGNSGGSNGGNNGRGGDSSSSPGGTVGVSGNNSGGAATGGTATGGTATGGTATGGTATSGAATGGTATGGTVGAGGPNAGPAGASSGGGAVLGTAGAAGAPGVDPRCPAYTHTGAEGRLITPPSADFETDGTWSTVTGQLCRRTTSSGSADGCQGSYYLTCSTRKAAFDGPKFDVPAASLIAGHRYYVTALARYSPATAPASESPLVVTAAWRCIASTMQIVDLSTPQYATSEWVRVSGLSPAITCDGSTLESLYFFVSTIQNASASGTNGGVDVDDFRLYDYDLTP